ILAVKVKTNVGKPVVLIVKDKNGEFLPIGTNIYNGSGEYQTIVGQAGVRVLAFKANSMDALRERVKLTGEALGPDAAEKAAQYERYFRDNIRRVQERLENVPASARLRVYHSMGNP
ncbi:hypothetical protein R0J93_21050, partial [Pseudoalteromonas sp. SIMBA_148]